jgi:hypothetical protein
MPMKSRSGKSSLAIPALKRASTASVPAKGRFTRMAPKPMGSRSAGSISRLTAR